MSHASFSPVFTSQAMQAADRRTIEDLGIPGFLLMENAGRAAVHAVRSCFGDISRKRFLIICGKGNNGGDGFVVARVLNAAGITCDVVHLAHEDECSEDGARNLRLLKTVTPGDPDTSFSCTLFQDLNTLNELQHPDFIVDALLGTGITSELRDPIRPIVDWINAQDCRRIAVDIPTGINGDTGEILGAAVRADLTVTMAARKLGLVFGEGRACAGTVVEAEIGIPWSVLQDVLRTHGGASLSNDDTISSWLPQRSDRAHKYNVGVVAGILGSRDFPGAAAMAATAAARVGAGSVLCACPENVRPLLQQKLTEIMVIGLPETADGTFANVDSTELAKATDKASSLLIGCGIGGHPETGQFIRTVLRKNRLPAVIDADGLNALQGHTDMLSEFAGGRWILTPHAGEFRRLSGGRAPERAADRIDLARESARRWNVVVLFKGLPGVVALPDGTVFVCGTGNPAVATAGSGDVLAGMAAGLLAQGVPAGQAAIAALHIGGACADTFADDRSARSYMATDLLTELPHILKNRFEINV